MGRKRQYQRHLKLVYGDQAQELGTGPARPFTLNNFAGRGLRVTFRTFRSNRGDPDRATINIYNLPIELRQSLRADLEAQWKARREVQEETTDDVVRADRLRRISDAFRVNLFVGYGPDESDLGLLFRGDLLDVTPSVRRGGKDTITRLMLGDTLLALRDSYMRQAFGTGATLPNILRGAAAAAALPIDEGSERLISIIGPNAVITKVENGWVGVGRVADTITEIIDQFGLQWWVRNGTLYFSRQGSTLSDFALQFTEGLDILDHVEGAVYGDIRARVLLNPDIVPGRGVLLRQKEGPPGDITFDDSGYRIDQVTCQGDTHGTAWWADFLGAGSDSRQFAPSGEFLPSTLPTEAQLIELEREPG